MASVIAKTALKEAAYSAAEDAANERSGGLLDYVAKARWLGVSVVIIVMWAFWFTFYGKLLSFIPGMKTDLNIKCYIGHGVGMFILDMVLGHLMGL